MQARLPVGQTLPSAERRHAPGWVDHLQVFVERLPWPWWASYLLLWAGLAMAETSAKWAAGVYPVGTIFSFHLMAFGVVPYALALMHFLDSQATKSLAISEPALELDEEQLAGLRHRLTTMPRSGTLLASLVGVAMGLAQRFLVTATDIGSLKFAASGWLFYYELTFVPILGWALISTLIYHSLRQLRMVDSLYRHHVKVNLFDTQPLYAFASLSARLALGVLLVCYAWLTAYPRDTSALVSQFNLAILAIVSVLAVVTFLLPLRGAHQRLAAEKMKHTAAVTRRLEAVLVEQHEAVDAKDFTQMAAINAAVSGLTAELGYLEKVSTWPWQGSTLLRFLAAVFVPMFLWAAQLLLSTLLRL